MPSKFWETAEPGFKARSELEARAKKLAQDEGTAFDQATGGAGFSQPIRPPSQNLSQKLRTGRVLPSQPAQNRPKFQGPTPTPGGSGFTVTRPSQPRIVHEPLQIKEKPLTRAHGFTPPNPLQIAARNVKDTLVGNVTDVGKTVIGSVAASHPEWQPGLKKKGLLPGEEPTVGGTLAGLTGFMGRAYTPDEIAGNPLLGLGPDVQIAGDIAMKAAGPALKQVVQGVKSYPSNLVKAQPRIVPERQAMGLAKKVEKAGEVKIGEVIARETTPQGTFEYQIAKNVQPDAPQLKYQVQMRIANPNGTYSEWESAYQGWNLTPEQAARNFANRYKGDISQVEVLNPLVKQGVDENISIAKETQRVASEKAAQESVKARIDSERLAAIKDEVKRAKFSMADTPIAGPEGTVTRTERGPSLNGLVITTTGGDGKWKRWNITHQGSGFLIADNFKSMSEAKTALYRLTQLTDWTQSAKDIAKKNMGLSVKRLQNDIYAELPPTKPSPVARAPVPPAAKAGQAKEPWETPIKDPSFDLEHRRAILQAIDEGKPVSRGVLDSLGGFLSDERSVRATKNLDLSPKVQQAQAPLSKAEGALPAAESVGAKGAVPLYHGGPQGLQNLSVTVSPDEEVAGVFLSKMKSYAEKYVPQNGTLYSTSGKFTKTLDLSTAEGERIWLDVQKKASSLPKEDRALFTNKELQRLGYDSIDNPSHFEFIVLDDKKLTGTKATVPPSQARSPQVASPVTGPRVNQNVIPDEAPSIEGVGFPQREAPLTVEGAGEGAMPPFGPEAGPPIPKQERVPLWKQVEAGQPPPPGKPPVASQGAAGLPSGRQPGGIQNQQPYNPQDAYQQLQDATAPANPSFKERMGSGWQTGWSHMADRVDTLKALEQKTGIPAYKLARLVPGATEHGEGIAKRFFDPVAKRVGKDYKNLQDYMILMRNQDLLVRNPTVKLPGGINGWKGTLEAMNTLKAKVGAERFAKIEAIADELWAVAKKYTIDERVGTFLDNEGATRITSAHPHHIPFKRQGFDDFNRQFTTPEASVSNTGLKKMSIYGSDLPLDEPLAHMRMQIIRTQVYKARNEAAEAVVRGAEKLQELTGEQIVTWIEPKGEMSRITKVTGETFNRAKKAEHSMTRETVSFFKDGKKYTAEIPTIYARAAKSMDKQAVNFWSKVARLSTAPIRYGATSWNPGFLPLNILRDAQGALFKERLIPFSPAYWKGWLSVLKKDEWYWKASDANTFMSGLVDSMKTTDAMSRGRNLGGIQVKNPIDALLVPFRLIEAANLLAERGTRIAAFRKLTAEGVPPLEVALRTREITVDFAKSGTTMQMINQVIPFSNAALQGTIITAQTIRKNPKQAAAIASLFMVPTILSRVNNMRFESSELIPDYEYTNNWVFQFGEYTNTKTGVKNPLYIKIPKGPIAGPVTFPGEAIFNLMRKTDDRSAAQIILESAVEAAKSASPIDPSIAGVMPSIAQTGAGLVANYDFFTGSPIVPQGESNLLPEQQFDENTSKAAVALGQGTHTSPRLIDWAIQNTAGGASEVTSWMVDLGLGALGYNPEVYGGVEPKADVQGLSQTPVVRRFVGTKGTQLERRGWDNLDSATDETNRTFNALPEVNTLGVRLGQVGDTIEKIEIAPQQRADYQKLMAEVVTPGVKAVISSGEFKQMNKDKKLETIQKEMSSLKEMAREQFLRTLPPEQLTPEAQQYLGKQEASRTLKPYFDIKESTFTQYGKRVVPNGKNGTTTLKNFIENTEGLILKARKLTGKELQAALVEIRVNKASSAWRTFDKLVKKKKRYWRMQHPENGDILWKYYGIKPIGR